MLRKFHIFSILIIISFALALQPLAADEADFRLYNSTTTTNNLDGTFIQGDVAKAIGQKIVVTCASGTVAEKTLPNTGEKYVFRIKIPKDSININGVTSYAVTAMNTKNEVSRVSFVRVRYKARKEQEIKLKDEEYKVDLPGDTVTIDAESSAGLDLKYESSDEEVVKVDNEGNIEPVSEGTAEITVNQLNDSEYEDASKTVKVSVKERPHYTVRLHLGKDATVDTEDTDEANETDASTEQQDVYISEDENNSTDADSNEDRSDPDDTVVEQKIAVGDKTELMAADEKKGDYEFLGWATSATGYPVYENEEEVQDLAEEDETVDLYAVWHGERAQAAIEWASMIAADNSFTYGQGTFKCYVCGTAPRKKYTCMPFLAAAYAHGAKDPIMLSGGRHVINLHDGNFKGELGQIWEKVGLCKNLTIDDLEPGDVIIKWSAGNNSGHAWMYGGGDTIIEAVPSDIHVLTSGAAAKLRRYGTSEGTPSKNYVMRYRF